MPIPKSLIDDVDYAVRDVVDRILTSYEGGLIEDEDHITGALVQLLSENLNKLWVPGIKIQAKAFTSKIEKKVGADFGILLDIQLSDQKISKILLAQAKKCDCSPYYTLTNGNITERLRKQCALMLNKVRSSYVIVYTRSRICGFIAIPASDIYGLREMLTCRAVSALSKKKLNSLFRLLLQCFTGDLVPPFEGKRGEPDIWRIIEDYGIRHLLYISLESKGWML